VRGPLLTAAAAATAAAAGDDMEGDTGVSVYKQASEIGTLGLWMMFD
jgi:hypothetical protein